MGKGSWFSRWRGRGSRSFEPILVPASSGTPSTDTTDYEQCRDRGLQALRAGKMEKALEDLGQAVHLRPDLAEAHLNLGQVLEFAGKIEASRQAYLRAQEIAPSLAQVERALARLPPPPPRRRDFEVGQVLRSSKSIAEYQVVEVKKGGFGVIYIVSDRNYRPWIWALKTFQARYLWSVEDRDRFVREALTWVMLDRHPHITTAFWVDEIEGFPCLVLEYVPDGDLASLLRRGPLPVEQVLKLALQFCDGMAYAHGKLGIVHRDIKPSNCLLTEDGTLKVTDFGLARAFGEAQEHGLEVAGLGGKIKSQFTTPAGTRQYMAPEQFKSEAALDTRTDIYAFAIVVYEMLTGELPWLVGSAAHACISESAVRSDIPRGLLSFILRCVEWEPSARPESFNEVREELGVMYRMVSEKTIPAVEGPSAMSAVDWNSKGLALDNLGYSEHALICFDRALENEPHNLDGKMTTLNNKGLVLSKLGRYEEALRCFEQGQEIEPNDHDLWKNKGNVLYHLRRFQEALACYEHALETDIKDSGLWANKGAVLDELGRFESALASCERGLEVDPRNTVLWLYKGSTLLHLARPEEALTCYDRGLQVSPTDPDLWLAKCNALEHLGYLEEALHCLDVALEVNPSEGRLWGGRGVLLHKLHRLEEALVSYEHGLEIVPTRVALWCGKGVVLDELGRPEEALVCYDRGLEIDSRDSGLWANKGWTLATMGRFEEALQCFNQGLEITPRDVDLWRKKCAVLGSLGRFEDVLICADRGLEIAPEDARLCGGKGMALLSLGCDEEALGCIDLGLKLNPVEYRLWAIKGIALHRIGRCEEALRCYDRALEIAPLDGELWENKGRVLHYLGRSVEAEECFRRARELGG